MNKILKVENRKVEVNLLDRTEAAYVMNYGTFSHFII